MAEEAVGSGRATAAETFHTGGHRVLPPLNSNARYRHGVHVRLAKVQRTSGNRQVCPAATRRHGWWRVTAGNQHASQHTINLVAPGHSLVVSVHRQASMEVNNTTTSGNGIRQSPRYLVICGIAVTRWLHIFRHQSIYAGFIGEGRPSATAYCHRNTAATGTVLPHTVRRVSLHTEDEKIS